MKQRISLAVVFCLIGWGVPFTTASQPQRPLRVWLNHVTLDVDKTASSVEVFCGAAHIKGMVEGKAEIKFGSLVVDGAVNGRIRATCAQVDIRGGVGERGIEIKCGDVNIEGSVRGPVIVTGGNVRVGQEAIVTGPVIIRGGVFRGDASRVERGVRVEDRFRIREPDTTLIGLLVALMLFALGLVAIGWWLVVWGLVVVAFYLLLALLFRGLLERRRQFFPTENLGLDLLAGVVVCAAAALLSLPLCCTCVGLPLLGLAFLLSYWFGIVTLGYLLGGYIWQKLFRKPAGFFSVMLAGLVTIQLSRCLPLIGGVLGIFYWLAAVGISARWLHEWFRARRSPFQGPPMITPTPPKAF